MNDAAPKVGPRVLLIEDNFLAALSLKAILERLGCVVVGPHSTFRKGELAAREEAVDVAFLDINLVGGTSYAIAESLLDQACPVIFVTGYGNLASLPPRLRDIPMLEKPVDDVTVRRALEKVSGTFVGTPNKGS